MLHTSGKRKRILNDKSTTIEIMMVIVRMMQKEKDEEKLKSLESQYEFFENQVKEKDAYVQYLKTLEPVDLRYVRVEPKTYKDSQEFKSRVKYTETQIPVGTDDLL